MYFNSNPNIQESLPVSGLVENALKSKKAMATFNPALIENKNKLKIQTKTNNKKGKKVFSTLPYKKKRSYLQQPYSKSGLVGKNFSKTLTKLPSKVLFKGTRKQSFDTRNKIDFSVEKIISHIMRNGEKSKASQIFYRSLALISQKISNENIISTRTAKVSSEANENKISDPYSTKSREKKSSCSLPTNSKRVFKLPQQVASKNYARRIYPVTSELFFNFMLLSQQCKLSELKTEKSLQTKAFLNDPLYHTAVANKFKLALTKVKSGTVQIKTLFPNLKENSTAFLIMLAKLTKVVLNYPCIADFSKNLKGKEENKNSSVTKTKEYFLPKETLLSLESKISSSSCFTRKTATIFLTKACSLKHHMCFKEQRFFKKLRLNNKISTVFTSIIKVPLNKSKKGNPCLVYDTDGKILKNSHQHAAFAALEIVKVALNNIKPSLEVRKVRIAGTTYQVPAILDKKKSTSQAIRWVIESARARKARSKSTFSTSLAEEFLDAFQKIGKARQKRDQLHNLALANRAYVRYRWW